MPFATILESREVHMVGLIAMQGGAKVDTLVVGVVGDLGSGACLICCQYVTWNIPASWHLPSLCVLRSRQLAFRQAPQPHLQALQQTFDGALRCREADSHFPSFLSCTQAGYGASLEGLWPYSYETCDVGTLQNQTDSQGNPAASLRGGTSAFNRPYNTRSLSWATGQKLSACTCPDEDHPGPKMPDGSWKGRASPEIGELKAFLESNLSFE